MSYRGGDSYDDRRGGDDRRDDRDRYDDRRGGGGGGGRYDDRRGGYDRRDRYDDRRGGGGGDRYDDRRDDRRGGGGGGYRGGGGAPRSSRVRLYVGRLTAATREAEIEDLFSRYGPLRRVDMKTGFCFVEYTDELDAKDACEKLDGYKVDGERLAVEYAKDKPRFGDRDGGDRGGDRGEKSACCYNCGKFDHWARDCPDPPGQGARSQRYGEGKCFSCGQQGHRARDCPTGNNGGGRDSGYESRGRPSDRDGGARRSASPRRASSGSPRKRSPSPRGGGGGGGGSGAGGAGSPRGPAEDFANAAAAPADEGMKWNVD